LIVFLYVDTNSFNFYPSAYCLFLLFLSVGSKCVLERCEFTQSPALTEASPFVFGATTTNAASPSSSNRSQIQFLLPHQGAIASAATGAGVGSSGGGGEQDDAEEVKFRALLESLPLQFEPKPKLPTAEVHQAALVSELRVNEGDWL
jgi:hypothetical protein